MRSRSSFWAELGNEAFEGPDHVVQSARKAMLAALKDSCDLEHHRRLEIDIAGARDLTDLWYLRPRLMQAISASHSDGQARAEETLHAITQIFGSHIGSAITRRFGAL